MEILKLIVLGGVGQLIRFLVGLKKAKTISKRTEIMWDYTLISIILGMVVGGVCGYLLRSEYIAFLGGYAGVDFIENFWKIYIIGEKKKK